MSRIQRSAKKGPVKSSKEEIRKEGVSEERELLLAPDPWPLTPALLLTPGPRPLTPVSGASHVPRI